MDPFSNNEFTPAHSIEEQIQQDEAIRRRAQEGFDSGRMHRVERPCLADDFSWSVIWHYMTNHMWVWVTTLTAVVVFYLAVTI